MTVVNNAQDTVTSLTQIASTQAQVCALPFGSQIVAHINKGTTTEATIAQTKDTQNDTDIAQVYRILFKSQIVANL